MARRTLKVLIVLFLVTLGTFAFLDALPGDPVDTLLPPGATQEQRTALVQKYGLDNPFFERYWDWMSRVAHGDLGRSMSTQEPVSDALRQRVPTTLELALSAMLLALAVAVPVGIICAHRAGGAFDRAVRWITSGFLATPSFLLGGVVLYVFAVWLGWFPIAQYEPWSSGVALHVQSIALAVFVLSVDVAVLFIRLLRNDMIATLQEDYVLSARARGLTTRRVLFAHALRPSLFSLVTVMGVTFGRLLGGAIIVESIFAIPGIGSYTVQAIGNRDYVVVQSVVLLVAIAYVFINVGVDRLYGALDPRVKVGAAP